MATFKIFITILVAVVFGTPVHAFEIGDSVKFPTDSSFGCMWIEDAREAASHVARFGGSKESSRNFVDKINGDMFSRRERPKLTATSRFCDFFFAGVELLKTTGEGIAVEYRVLKKLDDGYVCLTNPRFGDDVRSSDWEGRCLWVDLSIWNVQTTSK
jgi:hypothetical protein